MCMQSISRHEIKNVDVSLARGLWCIESPDIGPGGSTPTFGVAAASMSQISQPLWMLGEE